MIAAGSLRHQVTVLRPNGYTVDSFRQRVPLYTPVLKVPARVQGNGGGTGAVVGRNQVTFSHTVTIRNCSELNGLNETWRLLFQGRTLEIVSIADEQNLGALLTLTCAEEVATV